MRLRLLTFLSFFFIYCNCQSIQDSINNKERRIILVGIDFGFLQVNTNPIFPDTTSFKYAATEIDYYFGFFPFKNTMVGGFYNRFSIKSTNDNFPLKTGFGYQLRQYVPRWNWQWNFDYNLIKKIEGRPYFELGHQFTNIYTNQSNDWIKIDSYKIQEIFPRIGTSIRLYKPLWFNIALGTIYQPNLNYKKWLPPIWTTSIEIVIKK